MSLIWAGLAGIVSWSFLEYVLHSGLGHWGKGKNAFSKEHLKHHAQKDYFSSPVKKAAFALPVLMGAALGAAAFSSLLWGTVFAAGLGGGWLAYEIVHYRLHQYPPRGPWGRFLRRHHFSHHFRNPWSNYGVSSALWDRLLGSFEPVQEALIVPPSHALDWLCENGEIKAEFAQDYVLRRPQSRSAPAKDLS